MKKILSAFSLILLVASCNDGSNSKIHYFQVGVKTAPTEWRDSSFIVATSNPTIIKEAEEQLKLPIDKRKMLTGALERGSGNYNKNASHEFKWHFIENEWGFADLSAEVCDGRPYSDVDLNLSYWVDTVKRFCPWSSYISKRLNK